MRKPAFMQPRILKQAIISALGPAYTTKFPAEGYQPQEAFRGRPRFHAADCIGCGACAQVCPPKCIDVTDDLTATPPVRRLVQHLDSCIVCGQCERYCPTGKGVRMSNEWDYAGFESEDFEERIEKELLVCEVCGAVIAPAEQLDWLCDRLGPASFANPTLAIYNGMRLGYVEPAVTSSADVTLRQDRMALQCPRCRRKTARAA